MTPPLGPQVLSLAFGEEESIELVWTDPSKHDDLGAVVHNEVITITGQRADEQVNYWAGEVRQSLDEFLGAWRNYVRDSKR